MKYYLDAKKMRNKEEAHQYLSYRMDFPSYYGNNLDALYDVLTDRENLAVTFLDIEEENTYVHKIIKVMKAAGVAVK